MTDLNDEFSNRLYSIMPFKSTQSPPSSKQKQSPSQSYSLDQPKLSNKKSQPTNIQESLGDLAQMHKFFSQNCNHRQIQQPLKLNNSQTFTSISSTIDMLFSKIQKIKSQFSQVLQKSKSQDVEINYQFYQNPPLHKLQSQKNIQKDKINKENFSYLNSNEKKTTDKKQYSQLYHYEPLKQINNNFSKSNYNHNNNVYKYSNIFSQFQQPVNNHQHNIKIRDFHLGTCIGSGTFGDVYMCVHKQTGFICAIKKIFKSTIRQYNMQEQFLVQLKILYKLDHPNIIKLYGHFDDQYHIFLMMEYATDGSLIDKLKCTQSFASQSMDQILNATQYMHSNKVIHRDIKPENIVLALGNTIKLCDFGWAAVLENQMKKSFCGTLDYVSPEMKDIGQYNQSVDLWSLGVLTFQLIAGFPPYKQQVKHWKLCGSKRQMKWNWQVIYPPQITATAQTFIEQLLKCNPNERATIQQCKFSPFIIKYKESQDYSKQFTQLL